MLLVPTLRLPALGQIVPSTLPLIGLLFAGVSGCGPDTGLEPTAPEHELAEPDPPPAADPAAVGLDDDGEPAVYDADPDEEPSDLPPWPIALVHGFSGFQDIGPLSYFYGVRQHLEAAGHQVFVPIQPPYQATEVRASVLAQNLEVLLEETGREKVHLFCHSQGGLDCRYLVSRLGFAERVASIVTIATPHYGTPLADLAEAAGDDLVNPAGRLLGWLLGLLEGDPPDDGTSWDDDIAEEAGWAADLGAAAGSMTEEGAADFAGATPDHPLVPVYSVAGVSRGSDGGVLCEDGLLFEPPAETDDIDPLLIASGLAIAGGEGRPNDGIVPIDSMLWGTFLGCVAADHFDQIGQIGDEGAPFDHLGFYATLADFAYETELARAGMAP